MLAYLRGFVAHNEGSLVLDVQGVGYAVLVARPELYEVKKEVSLFIHMHWSQDQGPILYGFQTMFERHIFVLLISCSGIGPKNALALLQILSADGVVSALVTADVKALSSVSGVGARKAEALIVHLKDKVAKIQIPQSEGQESGRAQVLKEVSDALSALGYARHEVHYGLEELKKNNDITVYSTDILLRKALAVLAKRK